MAINNSLNNSSNGFNVLNSQALSFGGTQTMQQGSVAVSADGTYYIASTTGNMVGEFWLKWATASRTQIMLIGVNCNHAATTGILSVLYNREDSSQVCLTAPALNKDASGNVGVSITVGNRNGETGNLQILFQGDSQDAVTLAPSFTPNTAISAYGVFENISTGINFNVYNQMLSSATTQVPNNLSSVQSGTKILAQIGASAGQSWIGLDSNGNSTSNTGFYIQDLTTAGANDWLFYRNSSNTYSIDRGSSLLQITSVGNVTVPQSCAFIVTTSGAQNNVTGDGTTYTIAWGTEIVDRRNSFATPSFTAPVAGIYMFIVDVSATGVTASHTTGFVDIITTGATYRGSNVSFAAVRNASNGVEIPFSYITSMAAGDTAQLRITVSGGTKVVNVVGGNFQGFLLG